MGWGGPWSSLLRRLVIPQDAGPSDPRIVLGPDIPSELTTYYGDANITGAIIYWIDGQRYAYSAVIANPVGPYRVDGLVNMNRPAGNRVNEVYSYYLNDTGPGRIFVGGYEGAAVDPTNPTVNVVRNAVFDWDVDIWGSLGVDGPILTNDGVTAYGTSELHGLVPGKVTVEGLPLLRGQVGSNNVAVPVNSNGTSLAVPFPVPFPAGTTVHVSTNINTGSGSVPRWDSRAINISPTGFTIFVFSPSNTNTPAAFTAPVTWSAVAVA